MNFSLVDPATSAPLSTVTVHTATVATRQVAFSANPNPIALAAGSSVGKTTLSWNAPGHSALQIWVAGVLFAAGLPTSGSVTTGNWVGDGSFENVDIAGHGNGFPLAGMYGKQGGSLFLRALGGAAGYGLGLVVSALSDWPSGPAIVWVMTGLGLLLFALGPHRAQAS
jgi:hypothetical protein